MIQAAAEMGGSRNDSEGDRRNRIQERCAAACAGYSDPSCRVAALAGGGASQEVVTKGRGKGRDKGRDIIIIMMLVY